MGSAHLTHKKDLVQLIPRAKKLRYGIFNRSIGPQLIKIWMADNNIPTYARIMMVGYTKHGDDPMWQIDWDNSMDDILSGQYAKTKDLGKLNEENPCCD